MMSLNAELVGTNNQVLDIGSGGSKRQPFQEEDISQLILWHLKSFSSH